MRGKIFVRFMKAGGKDNPVEIYDQEINLDDPGGGIATGVTFVSGDGSVEIVVRPEGAAIDVKGKKGVAVVPAAANHVLIVDGL